MVAYGDDFPDFIDARISEVQAGPSLDYLSDVARLENAWVEAYHTEDALVATIGEVAALSADRVARNADRLSSSGAPAAFRHSGRLDLGVPSRRR